MKNFTAAIMLVLGAYANTAKPFFGGEVHSLNSFKYGRFVASMKSSDMKGAVSNFYLYDVNDPEGDRFLTEMNGVEIDPDYSPSVWTNMSSRMLIESWEPHDDEYLDDDDFHLYEIEWTPAYLSFSINGEEVRRKEGVEGLDKE